jgi:hypothetical protein
MNENQPKNQANVQATNQANEKNQAKTIVNGQEVTVEQAVQMQQEFEKQNIKTGIQAHHDNSTESVQAGQVAQNQTHAESKGLNIKQVNVQSGQSHLSQTQQQPPQQAMQQQSVDADARAKAKAKKEQ